jgi:SAM-dependent methyltransferase
VDASDERDHLAARPLARERSRLFDEQAEAYDRFRPTYPDAVIDELLGPVPAGLDVLDVGCGTGIASRQIAQRGAKVLGVELAPRMAEIARGHGVEVEIAAFEGWDAAGRTFDRSCRAAATVCSGVCGQSVIRREDRPRLGDGRRLSGARLRCADREVVSMDAGLPAG